MVYNTDFKSSRNFCSLIEGVGVFEVFFAKKLILLFLAYVLIRSVKRLLLGCR